MKTEILEENAKVHSLLLRVGVPANLRGFEFLVDCILAILKDYTMLYNMTKGTYVAVAEKHNTSVFNVERSIRHAISVTWNQRNVEQLNRILRTEVFCELNRPCISEFVAIIVQFIKLGKI